MIFKRPIWPLDGTQTSITAPGQRGTVSNGKEEVLHSPELQNCSHIIRCRFVSYLEYPFWWGYIHLKGGYSQHILSLADRTRRFVFYLVRTLSCSPSIDNWSGRRKTLNLKQLYSTKELTGYCILLAAKGLSKKKCLKGNKTSTESCQLKYWKEIWLLLGTVN